MVPIPDYTLYAQTGVTVALAWGLPDTPQYPDELMQQYEEGGLPLLTRDDKNITNVKYVETKNTVRPPPKQKTNARPVTIDNRYMLNVVRNFYDLAHRRPTSNRISHTPNRYYSNNNYWHRTSPDLKQRYDSYGTFPSYLSPSYYKPWGQTNWNRIE